MGLRSGDASMGDAVTTALRRRHELLRQLAEVDGFLTAARSFDDTRRFELRQPLLKGAELAELSSGWKTAPTSRDIVRATELLLRRHGSPLTRRGIYEGLLQLGVSLQGADPIKNLGTILWRSGKFDAAGAEGYWFSGEDRPAATSSTSTRKAVLRKKHPAS